MNFPFLRFHSSLWVVFFCIDARSIPLFTVISFGKWMCEWDTVNNERLVFTQHLFPNFFLTSLLFLPLFFFFFGFLDSLHFSIWCGRRSLQISVEFVDTNSFLYSKNKKMCEFWIRGTGHGELESPRHSLPPNTTCLYHLQVGQNHTDHDFRQFSHRSVLGNALMV